MTEILAESLGWLCIVTVAGLLVVIVLDLQDQMRKYK
jgi:hypothetical protein